ALDLAKRDGAFSSGPIRMEDGVVRILPALVGEPAVRLTVVFDKAVPVPIAVLADPAQGRLDVGPDFKKRVVVPGALEIQTREQKKERRGINRAVVAAEWHLTQVGHLAVASLVQDLAGLGIGLWIERGGLRGGERAQHPLRHRWIHPQHEQGRDEAVATEGG